MKRTISGTIYDLYFHNDFDGWASAAVMLSFLESRGGHIGHFVPIDHDLQEQWRDDGFFAKHRLFAGKRYAPVVLDFPFHSGTAFWFDHHPTTFKKEEWKKTFREDPAHAYRPRYASCCHMTVAMLRRNFGWRPPDHFRELTRWLDVIDGAQYTSAKETIDMKEPAFAVDSFINAQKDPRRTAGGMVRLLAEMPLDELAKLPSIAAAGNLDRRRAVRNLAFYRKYLVRSGNATIIDLMRHRDRLLRYAPYYLFPKVPYSIRITKKGTLYHLGVGKNPWMSVVRKVHIGELMKKYGGGGHAGAGAAEFHDAASLRKAQEEILAVMNRPIRHAGKK
jgi:hypothetical protein